MSNAKLVIIRGLPGSGKSTLANIIKSDYDDCFLHYENDQGLYINEKYVWTPERLRIAADVCFANTVMALRNNINVIVSNCFLTNKSIYRYSKLVDIENLYIIEAIGNFKSIHGVSEQVKEYMQAKFQALSPQLQSRKIEYGGSFHFEGIS